ncbi:AAA family ATPase, partial [Streptomyces calidiresistens]|nr:AAA family ATPase [Streptomyces calidiresistens]
MAASLPQSGVRHAALPVHDGRDRGDHHGDAGGGGRSPVVSGARRWVVTGTGTGVGKTVVTAALAAAWCAAGQRVTVVKPAQTGVGAGE